MKRKAIVKVTSVSVLFSILVVFPILIVSIHPAQAAETFPSKPIKFIIGDYSGSAFDTVGRKISPTLKEKLGVPVNPLNIKGALDVEYLNAIHGAEPDGYTFGFEASWHWMYYLVKPGGPIKFDVTELPLLMAITTYPDCVFASTKSKAKIKTAEDLLNYKKPIRVADYANLTPGAVGLKLVGDERGLEILPVVLESFPEAAMATVRGDVDIMTATPSGTLLKYVRAGDFIPLFIWSNKRMVNLPDVPCSRELGVPEELEGLMLRRLFMTPPGVPKDRMTKLEEGIKATLTDPTVLEWGKKAQQPLTFETGEECFKAVNTLANFYRKRLANIQEFIK